MPRLRGSGLATSNRLGEYLTLFWKATLFCGVYKSSGLVRTRTLQIPAERSSPSTVMATRTGTGYRATNAATAPKNRRRPWSTAAPIARMGLRFARRCSALRCSWQSRSGRDMQTSESSGDMVAVGSYGHGIPGDRFRSGIETGEERQRVILGCASQCGLRISFPLTVE